MDSFDSVFFYSVEQVLVGPPFVVTIPDLGPRDRGLRHEDW